MEDICVLDSENTAVADKPKANKKPIGTLTRKKLADISNIPQRPNPSVQNDIEQLKKENMALVKLLADRNKIIELSGLELQKLRVNLQKLQLQNMQLAQSNSHMLAELNSGKDTLKALHHELGCKNGLVQALRSELKAKVETTTCQKIDKEVEASKPVEREQQPLEADTETKPPCHTNRRQRSTSMGPTTTAVKQVHQGKEKAENKRPCVRRRQSARFRCEEPSPVVTLDDTKVAVLCPSTVDDEIREEERNSSSSSAVNEEGNSSSSSPSQAQEFERLSIGGGRPSRQAAKKVHSYKEVALNVKMRRTS